MMQTFRPIFIGLLCLQILSLTACKKQANEAGLVPCAGVLLVDGKPFPDAEIKMQNSRGRAFGKTDKEGKFRMQSSFKSIAHDGVQSGTLKVAVLKRVPLKPSERKPGQPDYKNLLHQRYAFGETSGIELVVPIDGIEDAVIEISTGQDPLLAPLPSKKKESEED